MNVHNEIEVAAPICEDDEVFYGGFGYVGLPDRLEVARNSHLNSAGYRVGARPSSVKKSVLFHNIF